MSLTERIVLYAFNCLIAAPVWYLISTKQYGFAAFLSVAAILTEIDGIRVRLGK